MKLYIYETETNEIVATATGETNQECERKAAAYLGTDEYGGAYNTSGLTKTSDVEEL